MNLARLIVIAVAIWLALYLLRRLFNRSTPTPTDKTTAGSPENMVRCAQCGLHLPEAEAIAHQGRYYCCEEHRRQHRPAS